MEYKHKRGAEVYYSTERVKVAIGRVVFNEETDEHEYFIHSKEGSSWKAKEDELYLCEYDFLKAESELIHAKSKIEDYKLELFKKELRAFREYLDKLNFEIL